jgi:hypothetical protein
MTLGQQFHWLMQQRSLGLPIEPLLTAHPQLQVWCEQFQTYAAAILPVASSPSQVTYSEHLQTLQLSGHVLTVVYDWLLLGDDSAVILDWKTYPMPRHAHPLHQNWQTRLYLFVLVETSHLPPEPVSMTYWFFQGKSAQDCPESVTIPYETALHEQTRQDLHDLLMQLSQQIGNYEQTRQDWPQVEPELGHCAACEFGERCGRSQREQFPLSLPTPLEQIAEVPLESC